MNQPPNRAFVADLDNAMRLTQMQNAPTDADGFNRDGANDLVIDAEHIHDG